MSVMQVAVAFRNDVDVFIGLNAGDEDDVRNDCWCMFLVLEEEEEAEDEEAVYDVGRSTVKSMGGARRVIAPPCWNICPVQVI